MFKPTKLLSPRVVKCHVPNNRNARNVKQSCLLNRRSICRRLFENSSESNKTYRVHRKRAGDAKSRDKFAKFVIDDPRVRTLASLIASRDNRTTKSGRDNVNPDRCIGANFTGGGQRGRQGDADGVLYPAGRRNARASCQAGDAAAAGVHVVLVCWFTEIPHSSWTTSCPGSMLPRLGLKK